MNPWEMDWGESKDKKPWEMKYSSTGKPAMEHETYQRVRPVQPTGNVVDLLAGAGSGVVDLLRGGRQRVTEGARALGYASDEDVQKLYSEEAERREKREFDPSVTIAEKAGRGFGMLGGTLPLAFLGGGQTTVGSTLASLISGALSGSLLPATSGKEAGLNTTFGAGGQVAGNLAARALLPTTARMLPQAQKDILDIAKAERVPLRTSEATGSNVIRNWEQMRANRPITGGMEQRFNNRQTEAINKAVTRKLGNEMSEVNDASLKTFQDSIGGEISGIVKGKSVPLDNDFFNALIAVDADANVGGRLTASPELSKTIDNALDLIVNKPQGVAGEVAQRIRSKLMDRARDARAQENTELANGLEDLVDGLKKSMESALSASEKAAWADANRRYARYKLVEEAFRKDPKAVAEGDVPINKLARVLEQHRPRSYVHGTGDFAGLAKLGQVIKPPGRSALLGESSMPVVRNLMDVASGAAWPVLESQLMQKYLTGGLPGQRLLRDVPGLAKVNDALMRSAGLSLLIDDESLK